MTDELPACSTIFDDRRSYRVWKRILSLAGKKRVFDLVEPEIRAVAKKIRNRQHPMFAGAPLVRPTDRKRKLLEALSEIRESRELVSSREIMGDLGGFLYGVNGNSLHALYAGAYLLQAMTAKRNFERHVMRCLVELAEIDAECVRRIAHELTC